MKKQNLKCSMPTLALTALALLSSCSKDNFSKSPKQTQTSAAVAGQYITINPKLDLVIFQDNSDSMYNALAQLQPQLQSFVSSLSTNWDYRVVVLPLLSQQTISSKAVIATDCSSVNGVALCVTPDNVGEFNSLGGNQGWINVDYSGTGNTDLGFANMNYNINNLISSGLLRSDSLKSFVVVSNGEEQTNVTYLRRADGSISGVDYSSSTTINSFNAYQNYFKGLKTSIGLNQFYSVVSAQRYSNCWGGGQTWAGQRYMNMASAIGGASFDLCNGGLANVLGNIQSSLKVVVQAVEFNYAVISTDQSNPPDWSTVTLTKNGSTLPRSTVNGWEPVTGSSGQPAYQTNHPTTDFPSVGSNQSGWMVQLNGSAKIKGSDAISISFQNQND